MQPYLVNAGSLRSLDIRRVTVADHNGLVTGYTITLQGDLKNPRLRLVDTYLFANERVGEIRCQTRVLERIILDFFEAVTDDGQRVFVRQVLHYFLGVR